MMCHVTLLVASVVVVDDADGAGAADRRSVLHHGQQLCLSVVRQGVADGHRHDVVHILSSTMVLPRLSLE